MAIAPGRVDRRKRLGVPEKYQERPTSGAVVRNTSDSKTTSVREILPLLVRESAMVQGSSPWLSWFFNNRRPISSAGRAPVLYSGSRGFDSCMGLQ